MGDQPHGVEKGLSVIKKLIKFREKYPHGPQMQEIDPQDYDKWANAMLRYTKDKDTQEHIARTPEEGARMQDVWGTTSKPNWTKSAPTVKSAICTGRKNRRPEQQSMPRQGLQLQTLRYQTNASALILPLPRTKPTTRTQSPDSQRPEKQNGNDKYRST